MMLAFLTIIAPLMAMTYPLDKLQDGSAQGFNTWLKEYIFNLLIQPVHLILYTVLIGASMDLVADNIVFALVALGFILQAEKILRKFFGFEKASTVAGGSALGGALAMQGISQMSKLIAKGGKGGKSGGGENGNNGKTNPKLRTADKGKDTNGLLDKDREEQNARGNIDAADELLNEATTPEDRAWLEAEKAENEAVLNPVNETERDRIAREKAEVMNSDLSDEEKQRKLEEIRESDTRGIGGVALDWAKDKYQGSKLEHGIQGVTGAIRNRRDAIGSKVGSVVRKIPKPLRNTAKTIGKGIKYIAPKAARFATKAAVKGTLMGVGAVAAGTAGLVSDDFSNVFKYGIAGIGAGGLAGSGINSVPDGVDSIAGNISNGLNGLYEATHTKDENEARQNRILDKQALRDPERVRKYQEELKVSKKEAHRIMKEEAQKYREAGVTDDKLIIKAMKASRDDFGADRASNQRILLAQMAGKVGDDQKKLKQIKEGLVERGVPKGDIDNYIKTIKDINKII